MFGSLGSALRFLRETKKKSQADLAREAGIGKSQLSKYENGKELPRLDSLGKLLQVLDLDPHQFFYTMHLFDQSKASTSARPDQPIAAASPPSTGVLSDDAEAAFKSLFDRVFHLYNVVVEDRIKVAPRDTLFPKS